MVIQAILFDVNGCLIDILTDEGMIEVFRRMRNFLYYQGVYIHKTDLRDLYFQLLKQQKLESPEQYAEFDSVALWGNIIELHETALTRSLPPDVRRSLPLLAAQLYRALTLCKKLRTYPGVQNVLDILRPHFRLAAISDGQSPYALPELKAVGLADYFHPIIVSGDYGFRKPDVRLFQMALDELNVCAEDAVYVGNDMYRDVFGAKQLGLRTVFFSSNQGDKEPCGADPDYIIYEFSELLQAIKFFQTHPEVEVDW